MNKGDYITSEFFEYLRKQKTKIAKRVLWAMNYDIMSIVEYKGYFWFEQVNSHIKIPNYVYKYAKRWGKKVKKLNYNY